MYLLDSCVCIDFMRGRLPFAYRLMRASDPRLFAVPAVVQAELLTGAFKSADVQSARRIVESFLVPFGVIPFDSACAVHYARIRAQLEAAGSAIGRNDLLIAATALAHGATLVTDNVREFGRVPGLELESWYEVPSDEW